MKEKVQIEMQESNLFKDATRVLELTSFGERLNVITI